MIVVFLVPGNEFQRLGLNNCGFFLYISIKASVPVWQTMVPQGPETFLSPSVRILADVGQGRGAGVVATDFIKAGKLLARQRRPLVWSSRSAPECAGGEGPHAPNGCPITSCDYCLKPYDHNHNSYRNSTGGTGAPAKRCGACKAVYYCSVNCQRAAWPRHKAECTIFGRESFGGP